MNGEPKTSKTNQAETTEAIPPAMMDAALRFWQAEAQRLRRGWLRVIQQENSCPVTGGVCLAKQCGCVEEMELLANERS